ncbi:MAG: MBOAT family protein [Lachnospiraceae bacterium]|nr:MBOAT family protein [Lachnospiraceae bacterium]
MLFNSLAFAIFLPVVFFLYWAIPDRYRVYLLFLASYYFYMSWNAKYVVLILFTTVISYAAALLISKAVSGRLKLVLLTGASAAGLGVLFFFKYLELFENMLARTAGLFGVTIHPVTLGLMLPVGISFYTFQTMSYVIDVYRGEVKAERNFITYAAFVSFFPQLVAGPIERTGNLLPQIKQEKHFSYEQSVMGLKLMAWGFFKKLVIADNLAVYVDAIYSEPQYHQGLSLIAATLFFTVQIYCDFSGYSDIAIGTAGLFGIDLMKNFASPYFAGSLKEFWSRWHISLSTWFRDYVYIPLGGNRKGKVRKALNQILTFAVSGLWHGANYTFLVWGLWHGIGQVLENLLRKKKRWISTFLFVAAAWVFFRAQSLSEAVYIFGHMFTGITAPVSYVVNGIQDLGIKPVDGAALLAALTLLGVHDYVAQRENPFVLLGRLPKWGRTAVYYCFLLFVLLFASFNAKEFVYFQF